MKTQTIDLKIRAMICRSCVAEVEQLLTHTRGVVRVKASYIKSSAQIEYDPALVNVETLQARLREGGYDTGEGRISALAADGLWLLSAAALTLLLLKSTGGSTLEIAVGAPMWTAFLTGLLQSPHCIGMCGGIMLAASAEGSAPAKGALLYNLGRVFSYSVIGGVFGALGKAVSYSASISSMVFAMVGLLVALIGLNMWGLIPGLRALFPEQRACRLPAGARARFAAKPLVIGALTGLMPCGSLYAMWLHAVSCGGFTRGAVSMLCFALGTVPLSVAFGALGAFMPRKWNKYLLKASAVLVTAMGAKMLITGLHML